MFADYFRNKKVLITGNTGFKGSWLSLWLLKLKAEVFGISKDIPTEPSIFKALDLEKKCTHKWLDICDKSATIEYINDLKPDCIFHLAAQSLVSNSYQSPVDTVETNVLGTCHVLETLRLLENECTGVIITSDKCYDNVEWNWGYREIDRLGGKDIYSGSKGAAELIFKSYFHSFLKQKNNIRVATARAGNVIGGGDWAEDRIVADCIRAWSEEKTVEIRKPMATRPWQHVLEPLSGYLSLAQSLSVKDELSGQSFNFGPLQDQNFTVLQLLQDIYKNWTVTSPDPAYIIKEQSQFYEAGLLKLNCDKALADLQWLPTLTYNELIDFTSSWYQAYYSKTDEMFDLSQYQIDHYENLAKQKGLLWTK